MKNKLIGLLLVALYFGNKIICDFFYSTDIYNWWGLNHAILTLCIVISFKYKENSTFIEKLFISMIVNNIYVLLFKNETDYTLNDLWFVAIFTIAQYIKKDKKDE